MPAATSPERRQRASSLVAAMAFRGRSILSFHHNQIASVDRIQGDESREYELFQSRVASSLCSLAGAHPEQIPSIPFLLKLLDGVFLPAADEFEGLLTRNNPGSPSKFLAAGRLLSDLAGHSVKSLDICNELARDLQPARRRNLHASIAALASGSNQLSRAKKALSKLLPASGHGEGRAVRATSGSGNPRTRPLPRSWSVGGHLQGMSQNLVHPPRGAGGLEAAVHTVMVVMLFAMHALAAALLPVAGGGNPVGTARQMAAWGPAVASMQERMGGGEVRRRSGGREGGVLVEVLEVERMGREMMEALEGGGGRSEVAERARELGEASGRLDEGLGMLERRIRVVFRRIVRLREEVMKCLEKEGE